ncbi:MAG: nitroreductase family protein [Mariprofundaceae bacterium]
MSNTKTAHTQAPIHDIIANRWSPRAFDAKRPVAREKLTALLEAARWAPSCFGDEPWRYIVCDKSADEAAWNKLLNCLAPKNQEWAKNAPVLMLACADTVFRQNGKPNRWAHYDTGAASISLCLQAQADGLAVHQMGGFDPDVARQSFGIPIRFTAMAAIAVGYQVEADILDEGFKAAELAERRRQPLGECFFAGKWDSPIT